MEKLQVNLIFEIMGRPKEHVSNSLNLLIDKLAAEKGVKLLEKKLHEPKPIEKSDLFTTFAELTLELDSLANYFGIMFVYMPSNIEIISPENLEIKNFELTELGNKLISRLHDYDAIAKKMLTEKNILLKKLYEVAPDLFKKEGQKEEPKQETPEQKEPEKKAKKPKKSKD